MIEGRRAGLLLAAATAGISGVAVFVNGYGVRRWGDATAYTTAKNLVAAAVLAVALAAVSARGRSNARQRPRAGAGAGLVAVAVIGGSVPFVLFFEGLARASSTDAAFLNKTLVVWVALLAVPLLGERAGLPNLAAVALLVTGQAAFTGGLPHLHLGSGEAMVLAATLLWSVEVVVAKRLLATVAPLTLGVARLGGGVVLLLAWLALRGEVGALTGAGAGAWGWAALTGLLLSGYVATWYGALARAGAIDVTSVLVLAALVTAALESGVKGVAAPAPAGVALVVAGGVLAVLAAAAPARAAVEAPA